MYNILCAHKNIQLSDELIKHDKNSKKHLNVMSVADSRLTYLKGKNDDPLRGIIILSIYHNIILLLYY